MKNNYFALGAVVLLSLVSTAAQAQADFRPGYIVRPAGDTVRGQVDYRGARRGAQQCLFRAAVGDATSTWLPTQLRGYGLQSGEHFISQLTPFPVSTDMVPAGTTAIPAASPAPQQQFLEVLTTGAASLLSWKTEANGEHLYVLKAGAPLPTELVQLRRTVQEGNISHEQLVPVYRGTLTEQFADCPAVLLSISKTEFRPSSLIAAVNRYNTCRQPDRVVAPSQERTVVSLDALVGAQASRTTYTTPSVSVSVPASLAPEVGLGLTIGRRVLNQKFAMRMELHYVQQVAQASYEQQQYQPGPNRTITQGYDLRFTTAYLRLPVLLRYTMPGKKVRPFLEAGASYSYAVKLDPQVRKFGTTASDWQTLFSNDTAIGNPFTHNELGLVAGLGLQLPAGLAGHLVSVLGRIEGTSGFVQVDAYSTAQLRGSMLVSFGLTKH